MASSGTRVLLSTVIALALGVLGSGCSDSRDKDTQALFDYVNQVRAEKGAQPWPSPDDENFQMYLQATKDDCASDYQRESTYDRYYTEDGEQVAEDYKDRLAVICPEEAATLEPPAAGASVDTTLPAAPSVTTP